MPSALMAQMHEWLQLLCKDTHAGDNPVIRMHHRIAARMLEELGAARVAAHAAWPDA